MSVFHPLRTLALPYSLSRMGPGATYAAVTFLAGVLCLLGWLYATTGLPRSTAILKKSLWLILFADSLHPDSPGYSLSVGFRPIAEISRMGHPAAMAEQLNKLVKHKPVEKGE